MALEISIVASAQRLQAQRDQSVELSLSRQREEVVARSRDAERLREDRNREELAARDLDRSRFQRDFIRDVADDQRFEATRELAIEDARIDARIDREVADERQLIADERVIAADRRAADESVLPLTPTTPSARPVESLPANSIDDNRFEQLLSERNSRLAERANAEQQFASQQAQAFQQSQRSIDELRQDPSSLPELPPRGGVVDFQA